MRCWDIGCSSAFQAEEIGSSPIRRSKKKIMQNLSILFRNGSWAEQDEFLAAQRYFSVYQFRSNIPSGSLVVPRYSALPFYNELEADVSILGSKLLNSHIQHKFVANFWPWYEILHDLTPKSWAQGTPYSVLPQDCSFVVKGATNSRKNYWKDRMFAKSAFDLPRVINSLLDEAELLSQGLIIREYVPLVQYDIGINGLPFTNEWRFFILNGRVIFGGYYWANEPEIYPGNLNEIPYNALKLADVVAKRIKDRIPFAVVDVGETTTGEWIVIELNDGQQSGLPVCQSMDFYRILRDELKFLPE